MIIISPTRWAKSELLDVLHNRKVTNFWVSKATPISERILFNNTNRENPSEWILTIGRASYLDTGYYICHRAGNTDDVFAKQFVFVHGMKLYTRSTQVTEIQ